MSHARTEHKGLCPLLQVYGSGQSASFTITNRVLTINALIQVCRPFSALFTPVWHESQQFQSLPYYFASCFARLRC